MNISNWSHTHTKSYYKYKTIIVMIIFRTQSLIIILNKGLHNMITNFLNLALEVKKFIYYRRRSREVEWLRAMTILMSFTIYIPQSVVNLKHRWPFICERRNTLACKFDESVDIVFESFPHQRFMNCVNKVWISR